MRHLPAGKEFHAGPDRALLLRGELPLEAGGGDVATGLSLEAAGGQRAGRHLRDAPVQHAAAQEHPPRSRGQLLPPGRPQERRQYPLLFSSTSKYLATYIFYLYLYIIPHTCNAGNAQPSHIFPYPLLPTATHCFLMIPYHVIPWPCYFHDTHCYLISFQTYATHCSLMIPYHVMPCYLLLPYYPTHCYLVILIDTMPCHAMLPPIIPNLCDPLLPNAPS